MAENLSPIPDSISSNGFENVLRKIWMTDENIGIEDSVTEKIKELYHLDKNQARREEEKNIVSDIERAFAVFINKEKPCDYERQLLHDHSKRVLAILKGKIIPPYELEVQPSGICNLKCKHCFGKTYPRIIHMLSIDDFAEIAMQASDFTVQEFDIQTLKLCGTTGEPLLNPNIVEGMKIFHDTGKKIVLFTNGVNLCDTVRDNRNEKYYDVISRNVHRLNLSLDADCAETFLRLKGKNLFGRIICGLENLVMRKNSENLPIQIHVSYVIGAENYKGIIPAAKILKNIGVDGVLFRIDFTDLATTQSLSETILESLEEAKSYSTDRISITSVYTKDEISGCSDAFAPNNIRCFNQYFWACIGPDCNLYACGHRTHAGVHSYGNIYSQPLKELWTERIKPEIAIELPDEKCLVCSPSSMRRNMFMNFLSDVPTETITSLTEKYVRK